MANCAFCIFVWYFGGVVILIVELNFPLPTWNRILAMSHWERKKLRDLLHRMTCMSTLYEKDSLTLTEFPQKRLSMDLLRREYLLMIRPPTSKKSVSAKKKAKKRKQY